MRHSDLPWATTSPSWRWCSLRMWRSSDRCCRKRCPAAGPPTRHAPRPPMADVPSLIPVPEPTSLDTRLDSPRATVPTDEPERPVSTGVSPQEPAPALALAPMAPVPVTMTAELAVVCSDRVAPAYPAAARQRGETGLVVVRVELDERGGVTSAQVERSSGHVALDEAAVTAVLSWRCTPPSRQGMPVKAVAMQPFNFSLGR